MQHKIVRNAAGKVQPVLRQSVFIIVNIRRADRLFRTCGRSGRLLFRFSCVFRYKNAVGAGAIGWTLMVLFPPVSALLARACTLYFSTCTAAPKLPAASPRPAASNERRTPPKNMTKVRSIRLTARKAATTPRLHPASEHQLH